MIADVGDTDMDALIADATAQLNSDINTRIVRERVVSIDTTRQNKLDGLNTTYYVRNWKGKWIGDMDDDGAISATDIIVHLVASDGTETTAAVSSIVSEDGKFILSSAPASSNRMYVTYEYALDDPSTPSKKMALACAFLTAAYCYEKINRGMSPQQVYGNVRFMRDMRAGYEYFQRYEAQITKINGEMGDFAEAEVF